MIIMIKNVNDEDLDDDCDEISSVKRLRMKIKLFTLSFIRFWLRLEK